MENNSENHNTSNVDSVFKSLEELKEMLRKKIEVEQKNNNDELN